MYKRFKKISIIGAGNVGSMVASRVLDAGLGDVVLLDVIEDLAVGKALDISDAGPILGYKNKILGTGDYEKIKNSDVIIVTAGFPRRPGMSREELLNKNSEIIREVSSQIKRFSHGSIVIVVTNPLDVMTYLAIKTLGFQPRKVIGCAGLLDVARFVNISEEELGRRISINKAFVLGSHGDSMVSLNRAKISEQRFNQILEKTKLRGSEIVSKIGTGSASFAPSAAVLKMLDAALNDRREVVCASVYLNGEYSLRDICIGVPVKLGKRGVEEIIEIELSEEERNSFEASAEEIRNSIALLSKILKI